ncbi:putative tRNA 2'-phosphotransferase [Ceratocystis fimbriata CBS 114723]|uniref:2'-phosphotransferase n=1 Tax=Ceratocystis fimbriata CBS 114723 TaxID=1035309 RepID=A0A2C5X5N1_9PEZI|nr:putative tRNA 2'-phosphotransferase [Ceratocystis fimbriata CBS 114723]
MEASHAPRNEAADDTGAQEPHDERKSQRGNRRGDRGGRGPGSGGGREEKVSRALSRLLRHKAISAGIQLDPAGFAPLDKVLAWGPLKSEKVTVDDVKTCTRDNAKQRFSMKANPSTNPNAENDDSSDASHWLIRANQGHSITLDSSAMLTEISLAAKNVPARVLHGTYYAFWDAIVQKGGLSRMKRNHVHCATGIPGVDVGVISGMRKDVELLVQIDVETSLRDGAMQWWLSSNGVVLTEGDENGLIPLKYFARAEGVKNNVGVLVDNGEKLADLPAGLEIKVPAGKNQSAGSKK